MHGRGGVRAGIAEIDAYRLAFIGMERILAHDGVDGAIEDIVLSILLHQVFDAELLQAGLAFWRRRVDLTLHDVVLAVDVRQPARRFDKDQSVHAIGYVLGNHGTAAVIDEQPWSIGLKRKGLRLHRGNLGEVRPSTRSYRRMKVERVHHLATFVVLESHFDGVSHAAHG